MSIYTFSNSILIVAFNYSNCTNNKDFLYKLYKPHFKHVIFYADFPHQDDRGINYVDIRQGYYLHGIFKHFHNKYRSLIDECDGLFYTMDDNIINVNILNLFRNDKIIYYYNEIKTLDAYSGWQWDNGVWGKINMQKLMADPASARFSISKFSGAFADWFYLPKKYLTDTLFDMFELFYNHKVFLELAIPSVINNMETDKSQYQTFTQKVLWGAEREQLLNKDYVMNSLTKEHDLILHPIKFNQVPHTKDWLSEIFCKDKCVIITTINKPTDTILKHIANPAYDVIIVGDKKTPDDYKALNCIYLDLSAQHKLFPDLHDLLPYNHYCRKNLGYLYAIKKGYTIIYETDDDNIPHPNFDSVLDVSCTSMISEEGSPWINIFKYFTDNAHIWPRGYPLSLINTECNTIVKLTDVSASIICGLVENDPDVDAIFRLTSTRAHQASIQWDTDKHVIVNNKNLCVFNTQNTFWTNSSLFACMYIPTTVSFRYCDILRGIITNSILKHTDNHIMYSSPNVVQLRNEHNLMHDFKSECEMYIANEEILEYLDRGVSAGSSVIELMKHIYSNLLTHNIVTSSDIDIVNAWATYF